MQFLHLGSDIRYILFNDIKNAQIMTVTDTSAFLSNTLQFEDVEVEVLGIYKTSMMFFLNILY